MYVLGGAWYILVRALTGEGVGVGGADAGLDCVGRRINEQIPGTT